VWKREICTRRFRRGLNDSQIGLATTISATEGMALTDTPVAAFINTNPAGTAADFVALINWGDGTTTLGTVTLVTSQDFNPLPGVLPTLHAAAFVVTGTHTYADESANEPLSVGIRPEWLKNTMDIWRRPISSTRSAPVRRGDLIARTNVAKIR
jgi:hypothetical protein